MTKRRASGDGAVFQRHDHPTCPPLIDGTRADHRCQGHWVAQVSIGAADGRRKRKTFYAGTEKAARAKLREALRLQAERRLPTRAMTTDQWVTYWLEQVCPDQRLKPSTLYRYGTVMRLHVVPVIGRIRVDRLEPEHVRAVLRHCRAAGLSDTTVLYTYTLLRACLDVAVRERKAAVNVAELIDRPAARPVRRKGLTLAEARTVLAAAGDDPRWWLAVFLGMRQGECLALAWEDVNLAEGTIRIHRSLGHGGVIGTPKSHTGTRTIPVPTPVLARLAVARAHDPDAELLFHRGDGRPVHPTVDWRAWHALLAKAGVDPRPLHAARNTAAALMEEAGVPPRMVAEILGHARVETTYLYQASDEDLGRKRRELAKMTDHVLGQRGPLALK